VRRREGGRNPGKLTGPRTRYKPAGREIFGCWRRGARAQLARPTGPAGRRPAARTHVRTPDPDAAGVVDSPDAVVGWTTLASEDEAVGARRALLDRGLVAFGTVLPAPGSLYR
jgi:hypothetical protein